jgi:aldehyde dehydrogenase (NAD+)
MTERFRNYINGEWVDPSTDSWTDNRNPADAREVLNQFPLSGPADVERAVAAALAAQRTWARVPAPVRGTYMFQAVRIFEERAEELAVALSSEEGKLIAEARGEVQKMITLLEFIAGEARRLNGETIPSEMPNTFAYTVRVPIGLVAAISPWNFPVAIPVWKAAPALVGGNAVLFKPSVYTSWTARIITEVFAATGLPAGVFNTIYGRGSTVGDRLVAHPDVNGITFTGSTEIGQGIYRSAAADSRNKNKKVQCEMGGKNPLILLADGDVDLAVAATLKGAFGATGQRCTATSRAIVHESVHDEFVQKVLEGASTLVAGPGLDPASTYAPVVNAGQLENALRFVDIAKEQGATIAFGGHRLTEGDLAHGYFLAPTLITHVERTMRIAREEVFGPVLSVLKISTFEEALDVANDVAYGLTSALYTRDINRVFQYIDRIETGMLHVNNPTIGGEAQMPFGGMKATGIGEREQGKTAIEFSTELKTVYIDYTGEMRSGNLY